jgi:ribosomal protein S18 acetylase RimI-like enzyme
VAGRAQQLSGLRRVGAEDAALLGDFVADLPEGDRVFLKEEPDAETLARWCRDTRVSRWLVDDGGRAVALLGIAPRVGWRSHVGELYLVVAASHRRRGLGRALARFGLTEAVRLGLRKVVVEVAVAKQGDVEMFTSMGFEGEALLKNEIRHRDGDLHDLVLLAHDVDDVRASMELVGMEWAVGREVTT